MVEKFGGPCSLSAVKLGHYLHLLLVLVFVRKLFVLHLLRAPDDDEKAQYDFDRIG